MLTMNVKVNIKFKHWAVRKNFFCDTEPFSINVTNVHKRVTCNCQRALVSAHDAFPLIDDGQMPSEWFPAHTTAGTWPLSHMPGPHLVHKPSSVHGMRRSVRNSCKRPRACKNHPTSTTLHYHHYHHVLSLAITLSAFLYEQVTDNDHNTTTCKRFPFLVNLVTASMHWSTR